ncbi:DMT family transporter [Nocardioides astragali]|uniref:DMT family transporter n=1 Tax=Nocardioides astragali TaxID=1776736 RepID=A0ABW2NBD7_9ACTN|nr:multidrug efflux SMR transporter [Nocardioides astragali]
MGLLLVAVAVEVAATSFMPRTNGFREPGWTALVLAGYAVSLALLALVVRTLPVSVAYAVWAGLGTAAVAVIGAVFLGEPMGMARVIAIAMIVAGVVVLNLGGLH